MSIELADKTPNPIEVLQRHRKRKLRAFMVEPDRGHHGDTIVWDAFWTLIYGQKFEATHARARAIEHELSSSDRTVGDVLDGWRPVALEAPELELPDDDYDSSNFHQHSGKFAENR